MISRSLSAIALLLAPAALGNDVARDAVDAYLAGNLPRLRALWTAEGAASLRKVELETSERLRVKCVEPAGTIVEVASVDASAATVHATVGWWETARISPASAHFRRKNLSISLVSKNGIWKIAAWESREPPFAEQLVMHPEQADLFLAQNPELIGPDLVQALINAAFRAQGAGKAQLADITIAIAHRVASLAGDAVSEVLALRGQSGLSSSRGQQEAFIGFAQRGLAAAERSGDPDILFAALGEMGRAYDRTASGVPRALELYERAHALEPEVEHRGYIVTLLTNEAALRLRQNDHIHAILLFERARRIARDLDDWSGIQSIEVGLAVLFKRQSAEELAVLHLRRAIEVSPLAGEEQRRGEALALLAESLELLGQEDEARKLIAEAIAIGRKANFAPTLGVALEILGGMYLRRRDFAAAIRTFEEAAAVCREGKLLRPAVGMMMDVAQTYLEAGQPAKALASAESCIAQARKVEADRATVLCRTIAGLAQRALGDTDGALASLLDAISRIETLRLEVAGDARERSRYFEHAVSPYEAAADLLIEKGSTSEAFAMAERARSRVLLDVLRSRGDSEPRALPQREAKTDAELSAAIARANRRIREENAKAKPDPAAIQTLTDELQQARSAYASFQATLYAAQPRLRKLEGAIAIASPADLSPLVTPSSAILEYVVGLDRTTLFVLSQSKLEMLTIPISRAKLTRAAGDFSARLTRRDANYRASGRALYDLLLRPAERALRGVTVIGIIPDGALWSIPFEALIAGDGRFVVETRAVYYAPSASVLAEVTRGGQASAATATLLAVGNPSLAGSTQARVRAALRDASLGPLPEAEEEVRALRDLYGAKNTLLYTGAAATESAIKSVIGRARIVHFATHALFDDRNPMYSQILLAEDKDAREDGLLETWELMRMDLRADLAVLSACETARGQLAAGEGVIGFSWALFVAGCPSSVVSHWKVSSAGSERLMAAFHRSLLAQKKHPFQKAAALRRAKLELLATRAWRHPYYWSAAVLVGSPRPVE